jgi:hypothetical protein
MTTTVQYQRIKKFNGYLCGFPDQDRVRQESLGDQLGRSSLLLLAHNLECAVAYSDNKPRK